MPRRALMAIVGCSSLLTACSEDSTAPADARPQFSALVGRGLGAVEVVPLAGTTGFSARITIELRSTSPNVTLLVQRAPEIGRALADDGICQRAAQQVPWSANDPPAPTFVSFPLPLTGPAWTVVTDASGRAKATWQFDLPTIADGTRFDVMFRLVDRDSGPTIDLRSTCFTVTVQ